MCVAIQQRNCNERLNCKNCTVLSLHSDGWTSYLWQIINLSKKCLHREFSLETLLRIPWHVHDNRTWRWKQKFFSIQYLFYTLISIHCFKLSYLTIITTPTKWMEIRHCTQNPLQLWTYKLYLLQAVIQSGIWAYKWYIFYFSSLPFF